MPMGETRAGAVCWRWVEVDLDRIEANVRSLTAFLAGASLLAIVKADGYGHGMVPAARRAVAGGAAMLGVTGVEEGRVLRQAGITVPILLLQPLLPGEAEEAVRLDLAVTVMGRHDADLVARAARTVGRRASVHVKVDTGMGRFGAFPSELESLVRHVAAAPELKVEGIFSHLSAAEERSNPETARQIRAFRELVATCRQVPGAEGAILHLANTAGALYYPDARFHMCRIGLGCYGVYPVPEGRAAGGPPLDPALSLKSRLAVVRDVPAGFPVGYGSTYRTPKPTRIGIVAAGYANGVPRGLSNRGRVLVRGRAVPIVGRVCMNQTMVDLGAVEAAAGDEVVFLGEQGEERITVWDWCRLLGTLPHELLCSVGNVAHRVYRP